MLNVEKAKIYGVDKVGQSSPDLSAHRTDDAVGLNVSVGTTDIISDFDKCYPWCDMSEVIDAAGNVFIKIPKFYSKITKNAGGTYKHQLSGLRWDGFSTLFVDGKGNELEYVLVGKYEASGSTSRAFSKSGQNCLVNVNISQMRNACKANGAGYQQYDFLIDAIIKELWLIEMATTNCQSVMRGFVDDNEAAIHTGNTDGVKTPSGSDTNRTDGQHACKYRGIENPFGNIWKFVDGINFQGAKIFVCTDPTQYASNKYDAPYQYVGDRLMSNGYLSVIEYFAAMPLLGYTKTAGGSENSYYSDYYYQNSEGTILLVGGSWNYGADAGLWYWDGDSTSGLAFASIGGRLCYKPVE